MKNLKMLILSGFMLLLTTTALAGMKLNYGDIQVTDTYFIGSFGATRDSASNTSMFYSYEQSNGAGFFARNDAGTVKTCFTSDPQMVERIRNLNNDAYVIVYYSAGECTRMYSYNHSAYKPKL